jgi:hypothetical protein
MAHEMGIKSSLKKNGGKKQKFETTDRIPLCRSKSRNGKVDSVFSQVVIWFKIEQTTT